MYHHIWLSKNFWVYLCSLFFLGSSLSVKAAQITRCLDCVVGGCRFLSEQSALPWGLHRVLSTFRSLRPEVNQSGLALSLGLQLPKPVAFWPCGHKSVTQACCGQGKQVGRVCGRDFGKLGILRHLGTS